MNTLSDRLFAAAGATCLLASVGLVTSQSARSNGPAGKRLVITDVAAFSLGSTTVQDVLLVTTVAGTPTGRTIPSTVNNHGIVYANASLTGYADPGSTVTALIDDADSNDSAGMNVDIHGYFVNVP